eukprot:Hpha_TRINITY_DN9769_c0_g2::TRINITY_DN9769_c0_g2_i1::g.10352::m.10352
MSRLCCVAEALRVNARVRPQSLLAWDVGSGRKVTHAEFYTRCKRLGRWMLGAGVCAGDRVAVISTNRLEVLEVYGAAALAGFVVVPINPLYSVEEAARVAQDAGISATVADVDRLPLAETLRDSKLGLCLGRQEREGCSGWVDMEAALSEVDDPPQFPPPSPGTLWSILYTSGTTSGTPKGVKYTQEVTAAGAVTHAGPLEFTERSRGLVALPMHAVSSFFFSFVYVYLGMSMSIVAMPPLDPSAKGGSGAVVLDAIRRTEPTYVTLGPAHLEDVVSARQGDEVLKSVTQIVATGAPGPAWLASAVQEVFPRAAVHNIYGSTEAGLISILSPGDTPMRPGSVGKETPGTHLCRLTNDEGLRDAQGYLYLVGRADDR